MSQQKRATYVVTCADCDVRKATDDANETVAFYRRHHGLTGHDVAWERADGDALDAVPDEGDLEAVISALEDHYDDGVPLGVVAAAMGERGLAVGETLDRVRELRMTGALFEPRDDHLRVT